MDLKNKKLIVFDLDGTLAESKQEIDAEMAGLIANLLKEEFVAVIGGGTFKRFEKQFAMCLPPSAYFKGLFLMPINGGALYVFQDNRDNPGWTKIYSEELLPSEKKQIQEGLSDALKETNFPQPNQAYGQQVDDRGGQMTFSALGQEAPLEEKQKWSQEHDAERRALVAKLQEKLPDLEVKIAGMTSLDITHKGVDKKFGLEKIMEYLRLKPSEVLFVGDAIYPGGNDEPASRAGEDYIKVNSVAETKKIIRSLLG